MTNTEVPAYAKELHRHEVRPGEFYRCRGEGYVNDVGFFHACPYIPSPLAKYFDEPEDDLSEYEPDPGIRDDWRERIGMTIEEVCAGRRNSVLEDMTIEERMRAMEERQRRTKAYLHQLVAEYETRLAKLEQQVKELSKVTL